MGSLGKLISEKGWTLFLDRDGVINTRLPADYVKAPEQFEFNPGVLEAMEIFSGLFSHVFVVTNQQGIGRGLMTNQDLNRVHEHMISMVNKAGGKIDKVYYSPDLSNKGSFTRKPAVGMGLKARKEFPEIRFKKSIMVGDTFSDMLFGRRLDMIDVLITTDPVEISVCGEMPDYLFPDLISFAKELKR
ncbi:MAG: HAD-IIIA family hydrolase [Bacteroidales bacterium]|nr:HAD-IIIA family hydrolase [Bacteroidales bacterium]